MTFWDFVDHHPWVSLGALLLVCVTAEAAIANAAAVLIARRRP